MKIAWIDDPLKPRHGTRVILIKNLDDYNRLIEIDGKQVEINHSYLSLKKPIMIGNFVVAKEDHWDNKCKSGDKIKVIDIKWNEHLASRSYCARYTYKVENLKKEQFYMDDYQVKNEK